MPDPTLRQITLLQLIPRRFPGASSEVLQRKLEERGFPVSLRTVQRDLVRLSGTFALVSEDDETPHWSWMQGSDGLSAPAHDAYSALTWSLIEEHLEPLLPVAVRQEAQPQFTSARKYLEQSPGKRFQRWSQRVRVIPRAFSLQTPEVSNDVLEPVYNALFETRQLEIDYRSRGRQSPKTMRLHPLGLILREGVIYLLGTIDDYTDLRQLVAHRIHAARMLEEPVREPENFDLDDYIKAGGFAYVATGPIELVIRVEEYAAEHIIESPVAPDQTFRRIDGDRIEITASTVDTLQLRWWLTGFGNTLEVIAPAHLRNAMAEQARKVAALYEK